MRLRAGATVNNHRDVLAQGVHGGLGGRGSLLAGLVSARDGQRAVLGQQLQGKLVVGNTHRDGASGLAQVPAQRGVGVKNDGQRAGPETVAQVVDVVRNVIHHAGERRDIKDEYGRRHGAVAALICQQFGNALMREGIGGNTVDGIGGHHNRVVRLEGLAGGVQRLAGLGFSRYGVQLCSHGLYCLTFYGLRRYAGEGARHGVDASRLVGG